MIHQELIFTNSVAQAIDKAVEQINPSNVFVLVDINTERHVLQQLRKQSAVLAKAMPITVKDGDEHKNLESLTYIWECLCDNGATRNSLLINLGGGVITDMGAFAAATFKRGIHFINVPPLPMSSSQIRGLLKQRQGNDLLMDSVYSDIIRNRLYSAQMNLQWLEKKIVPLHKPKRLSHVFGVREEASRLAKRWGVDPDSAEEAGLLHDITKKLDVDGQLLLIDKYGIIISNSERENPKLLHAITGSEFARREFGVSQEIFDAIRWHTTGRPKMSMLEKVIYLADCIEPNRSYPGVEVLRAASYDDIDKAMCMALKMSIDVVRERGDVLHPATLEAYEWYRRKDLN